jgi:hypothetical protein
MKFNYHDLNKFGIYEKDSQPHSLLPLSAATALDSLSHSPIGGVT